MEEARTSARNSLARNNHSNGSSKIVFVSKKNGVFHLVADAAKAPELFAAHLIRTRTAITDYELFFSCPKAEQRKTRSRTAAVLKEYRKGNLLDRGSALNGNLSPRQIEVSELVGRGLINKEIADKVNLSVFTVKHHLGEIYRKLGMKNREQLCMFMTGGTHETS